ncbi:MAG: tRNA (guanosine-2-O-)-methyltransferase [Acidimicrobiaceae bacterium]|jgi:tRNA (guanosine-2'-O-)-methyltransferase|nr:tRNA (guanosine-2-O-)-methyltransferase [Acidimicrobiaceae bacterium]
MKQLGPTDLKRLHREWNHRTDGRVALLLDSVESPWNVGGIARTAAAFRVDHLYLAGSALSPAHAKAGKTAMGTERYLTWTKFERGPDAAAAARADGFRVVGLELAEGAVPLHELESAADICLAIGHEDHGLSPATLAACDLVAFIPQLGRVGSLNVATATAIAIYEVRRREWQTS